MTWTTCVLSDLVELDRTQVPVNELATTDVSLYSLPAFDDGGIPERAQAGSILSGKLAVDGPCVLLSKLNPQTPRIWLARPADDLPAVASTEFLVLKPKAGVADLDFVYYLLKTRHAARWMGSRVTGTSTSHQRVRPDDALATPFQVPDIDEQAALAAELVTIDYYRRNREAVVASAWSLAGALYEQACQQDGRDITLADVAEFHNRKRVPLSRRVREQRKGPYRYYGATGIFGYLDDFIFDGQYLLTGEDGTVMTKAGAPNLQYVWGRFWVNNHAHVLTGSGISTELLRLAMERSNVDPLITGAVQPKLSMGSLKRLKLVVPGESSLSELTVQVRGLADLARQATEQSEAAGNLAAALLESSLGARQSALAEEDAVA